MTNNNFKKVKLVLWVILFANLIVAILKISIGSIIDMHIMTKPDLSIEESHELIHSIEQKIRANVNKNVQLIAHLEPFMEGTE